MINILYDSYNLQANGVTTASLDGYSAPNRELQVENIAGADGGILVEARYRPSTITASGTLQAATQLELETLIQLFKRSLNKVEKELSITDEGSLVTYIATPSVISVERNRGLTRATWQVDFLCSNPFGVTGATTTLLNHTFSAPGFQPIEVDGSYKASPLITITINSFTGTGDRTISVQNGKTFAGITLNRTWTAGDEIEIDSLNYSVKVNGSEVDFSGLFPSWETGNGTLYYVDTFTARDVDVLATYKVRKI